VVLETVLNMNESEDGPQTTSQGLVGVVSVKRV